MIIWIFFQPGSGGDGLANLLEQSTNVVPLDGNKQWRIHRYVDSQVKFWAPNLQNADNRFNKADQLNDQQIEIANSNDQYLIITSHDVELKYTFRQSIVPDTKNIKILLRPANLIEQEITSRIKNLVEFNVTLNDQIINNKKIIPTNFDIHLNEIPNSWQEFKNFIAQIGLNLSEENFNYYKKIVSGEVLYTTPGIDYYKSFIDADNITKYIKIGDNKPN